MSCASNHSAPSSRAASERGASTSGGDPAGGRTRSFAPAEEQAAAPTAPAVPAVPAAGALEPGVPAADAGALAVANQPVALAPPPWSASVATVSPSTTVGLRFVRRQRHRTSLVNWFVAAGSAPPRRREEGAPDSYRGVPLSLSIPGVGDTPTLRIYEAYGGGPSYLVGVRADTGEELFSLDFTAYRMPPDVKPGKDAFVVHSLKWAAAVGDLLYVAHAHNAEASSSNGKNGYITAVRIPTGAVAWRSRPLVANAETFVVVDDSLVSGYGFAREANALFVLNRHSGEVGCKIDVKAKPEFLWLRGDELLLRTYRHDEVYALTGKR